MTAQRTKDWNEFATKVADHIENYTVPQYGDAPNDNVESWSAQDCIAQVQKYAARFGNNQRTGQEELIKGNPVSLHNFGMFHRAAAFSKPTGNFGKGGVAHYKPRVRLVTSLKLRRRL